MAYWLQSMFGERSLTKIAGVFANEDAARKAAQQLTQANAIQSDQLRMLRPADARLFHNDLLGRKLLPEQRGIAGTLWRAHIVMGLAGGVAGLLLYAALLAGGHSMMVSSPQGALIAFTGFGITFGLIAGGLIALRPDQIMLLYSLRRALRNGQWAVVVHSTSSEQTQGAENTLRRSNAQILKSF